MSSAVEGRAEQERTLTLDEVEDAYNAASMYAVKEWHGYQDGNWNVKADFAVALCKLALKSFAPSATGSITLPPCDSLSKSIPLFREGEKWYCGGCGANELEPRCKFLKSVPVDSRGKA